MRHVRGRGARRPAARRAGRGPLALLALLALARVAVGQAGDHEGEEQPPLPSDLVVPPAPALSALEELSTFALAPGLRAELVASEPFVRDPVSIAFDAELRMWVVEMTGYMPDVDGRGEREPCGAIAVLRDLDGDGRMDERTTFLDGLVLPRGVLPLQDGVLVVAPPELLFCRDLDGDGRADEREVVATGIAGIESPEHAPNTPTWTIDNWIRLSNHDLRYRRRGGVWERQRIASGGQWGLTHDAEGRARFNNNSDPLRGDLVAPRYVVRNPNHGHAVGANEHMADDRRVWPGRMTPGINRGYQERMLDDEYRLTVFTGACAPHVFLGGGLPEEMRGDVFVAEPCGNLVKRFRVEQRGPFEARAVNAYEGREVWTSTDERFRPVDVRGGPDGALYVVDMYRGLIQHRIFVTSFLRAQVLERGLELPIHLGRVWRLVAEDAPRRPVLPARGTADLSWTELAALLAHRDAWWRRTAQRVIVEEGRGEHDASETVRAVFDESASPLGRMHALWTLDGLDAVDRGLVRAALADEDPRVVRAGVRVAERFLGAEDEPLVGALVALARTADARTRHQVLLSLGEARTRTGDAALLALATEDVSTGAARSAILSGLYQRELELLERALAAPEWREPAPGRDRFLHFLARCVVRDLRTDRIARLLDRLAAFDEPGDVRRAALLGGVLEGRPLGPDGNPGFVRLAAEPAGWGALFRFEDDPLQEQLEQLRGAFTWPGGPALSEVVVRPLEPLEQARFERGRELYAAVCAACHQPSGLGDPGQAPPLRYSPYTLGDRERLLRIVLHGLVGPVEVRGGRWDLEMPAYDPGDEDLAAVLTYVRREWGHGADPVAPEDVARVRAEAGERLAPWTLEELERALAGER